MYDSSESQKCSVSRVQQVGPVYIEKMHTNKHLIIQLNMEYYEQLLCDESEDEITNYKQACFKWKNIFQSKIF